MLLKIKNGNIATLGNKNVAVINGYISIFSITGIRATLTPYIRVNW